ncbi:MAG: M23 family metallopeptidase [Thermodesulfobacteriota bacterium]
MGPKLHFIVTSEQGQARTFVFSKPALKKLLAALSAIFLVSTVAGIFSSIQNLTLKVQIDSLENNVSSLSTEKKDLQDYVVDLKESTKAQLTGAYGELNQRSQIIDSILTTLDITPTSLASRNLQNTKDTGGPFTRVYQESFQDLVIKVDKDLKMIKPIPLGYPINANRISSVFGRRTDPMNGQSAFHDGIDLSGKRGSDVRATADGKIVDRGYNDTYGWYVKVNHGNNYSTMYAHNSKIVARWGSQVKRGDVIAKVGNTGRSTGPHLHYEIRHKGRPINPSKYLKINKLIINNNG